MPFELDGVKQIDAQELKSLIDEKANLKLIDVREPHEYQAGHIPGIPLIPMQQIPQHLNELDKDTEYVFICRSGNRSQHVAKFLQENGFTKVANYNGGMLSWPFEVKSGSEE